MSRLPVASSRLPWWALLLAGGGVLVVLGLCSTCALLSLALDPMASPTRADALRWLVAVALVGLPLLGGGGWALWYGWQRQKRERQRHIEEVVLALAQQQRGRVSATELAMSGALSLGPAQAQLDALAARGVCRMEMDEQGVTYFVFPVGRSPEKGAPGANRASLP